MQKHSKKVYNKKTEQNTNIGRPKYYLMQSFSIKRNL